MQARAAELGLAGNSATSGWTAIRTGHTPPPETAITMAMYASGGNSTAAGTTTRSARAGCTSHSWTFPGTPPPAGAIAQCEKTNIVLKLRGARERMKARTGRCEGRKPYGAMDGEQATIARMKELRAAGVAYD